MPSLIVALAGGEEVLPTTFWEAGATVSDLAGAASHRLRRVAPAGKRLAHPKILSEEHLADRDVVILVVSFLRVFTHRHGSAFAAVQHDGCVVTRVMQNVAATPPVSRRS